MFLSFAIAPRNFDLPDFGIIFSGSFCIDNLFSLVLTFSITSCPIVLFYCVYSYSEVFLSFAIAPRNFDLPDFAGSFSIDDLFSLVLTFSITYCPIILFSSFFIYSVMFLCFYTSSTINISLKLLIF